MKKIIVFVLAFMTSFLVFGCEEVENKDMADTGKDIETSLVEKIELSAIKAPKEVSVYSAVFFDRKPEEMARIFFGDDYKEGEKTAVGRMFVKDAGTKNEKLLYAEDSGKAYFGKSDITGYNGINYGYLGKSLKIDDSNECQKMTDEYSNLGQIQNGESDWQDKEFLDKQKMISEYLNKLGADDYELYTGKFFNVKKQKCCLMYFKPTADGIPVSNILYNVNTREVYNSRYSIVDEDVIQLEADLKVLFSGNELVDFYCSPMINVDRMIKKYPVVSVNDAYNKVKERYPKVAETDGKYELMHAKLQYELIAFNGTAGSSVSDGKLYMYPAWVFGVHHKEKVEFDKDWDNWDYYDYYIVDAVTGEFFSNIPKEILQ